MRKIATLCLLAAFVLPAQGEALLGRHAAGVASLPTQGAHATRPSHGTYIHRHSPYGHAGMGYRHHSDWRYSLHRRHFGPSYYSYVGFAPSYYRYGPAYYSYTPAYVSAYAPVATYGSYRSGAANGFWLGALAGGIIGHNSGEFRHNGWRGAAWGAGLGWLLGTVVDASRTTRSEQPTIFSQPAPAVQPATAQQPITIINNYYGNSSPMSSANSLFGR